MKHFLLSTLLILVSLLIKAQAINELPAGKYETKIKTTQGQWEKGDIIIINDSQYKLSKGGEVGEYKFSVAAQRIFFITGPLKSAFTKVSSSNGNPVIVLPLEENKGLGITAEVLASKQ